MASKRPLFLILNKLYKFNNYFKNGEILLNLLIMGSTGMVGNEVLSESLKRDDISKITVINRKKQNISDDKVYEVIHTDFNNYENIKEYLKNQDACVFCIGVYTGSVPSEEFEEITVDYTKNFADALVKESPEVSFSFLSGSGADQTEKSKILFARCKGIAENYLLSLNFKNLFIFRPGYIYPVKKRKEPNIGYKLYKLIYKTGLLKISKNLSIKSDELAKVMLLNAIKETGSRIFENKDMINYLKENS